MRCESGLHVVDVDEPHCKVVCTAEHQGVDRPTEGVDDITDVNL